MKKTVGLIIAASLLVTLSACGGKSTTSPSPSASSTPVVNDSAAAAENSPAANSDSPFAAYGKQGYKHATIAAAISPYLAERGMNAIADQTPSAVDGGNGTLCYVYKITAKFNLMIYEYNDSVTSISLMLNDSSTDAETREQFSYACLTLLGAFEGDNMTGYAEQLQITETQPCVNSATSAHCDYSFAVDNTGMSVFTVLVF